MNETASELVPGPLPPEAMPPAVQKLVAGASAAKLMAAKGIAPLRPGDLVLAIYQLSFDEDAAVKAAAEAAPAALPDKVLTAPLAEPLPPGVLHFYAERLAPTRVEPLEKILFNAATADATFVRLAGRLGERELEVIVQNETRLLRCPAIVAALFNNKQARMSSVNRAIELCARHDVRVAGIPCFDEIARSITDDPTATDPAVADPAFDSLLEAAEQVGPDEVVEDDDAEPGEKKKKRSVVIDFARLKLHEKIRLATLGNAYCRGNLIRDSNKMVAMAVIRSPLLTESEVVRAAGSRQVCEDVIRYIANQRDYMKLYTVKHSLVTNPKCPVGFSLRLLPHMHAEDLKALARSKNIPSALATAARKLMQTRAQNG
jgi:hypothetical protein